MPSIPAKGTINVRELRAAMRALGFQVKREEVKQMLDDLDIDGHSQINLSEFTKMMTGKMVTTCSMLSARVLKIKFLQGSRDTKEEIMKVFQLFDEDNSGFITEKNLRRICHELGEQL